MNLFPRPSSGLPILLFLCSIAFRSAAQSDSPRVFAPPAESSSANPENKIDPAADVVLQKMELAYQNLKSAELGGHVEINLDFPGTSETTNQAFKSSFEAPNKFKHEMTNGLVLGSDGDKGFVYDQKAKSYARFDFPMAKLPVEELPPLVPHILQVRNPSLLFALSKTPFTELAHNFDEVKKLQDANLHGTNYTALRFGSGKGAGQITMLVDQNTQLLRRFVVDFKSALEEAGKDKVHAAMLLVDYASVRPNASISEGQFDWTPPEESTEIHEAAGAARHEKETKVELEGTVAPNFTLTSLDQKVISLYELRGKVIVLTFWSTADRFSGKALSVSAEAAKEEADPAVQYFSINSEANQKHVAHFLETQKLKPTVLMDDNGNIAKLFGVKSTPETIVIGKEGIVLKVIDGASTEMKTDLQTAIREGAKGPKN